MGKRLLLVIQTICFLLWAGCSLASREEVVANILDLSDEEFFSADQSVLAPRESRLLDMDFFGVAVNVPHHIVTAHYDRLPLIMATRTSGVRGWDVRLRDNCILVATNLWDGTVQFAKAFDSSRKLFEKGRLEKVSKGPLPPPGLAIAAAKLTELNPKDRLDIRWNTGSFALGVINYDWPSNTVEVELQGDEAVRYSTAMSVSPAPDTRGTEFLPCFLPTAKTPKSPVSGLTFTTEFRVEGDEQHLNIFASFAVPVRAFNLSAQKKLVHHYDDGRQASVAAVIPVTFAVLGLDWDEPLHFDWAVPVYGEPLKIGVLARGNFSIDALATDMRVELSGGKYVCYIVMDGRIFGPRILQLPEVK